LSTPKDAPYKLKQREVGGNKIYHKVHFWTPNKKLLKAFLKSERKWEQSWPVDRLKAKRLEKQYVSLSGRLAALTGR